MQEILQCLDRLDNLAEQVDWIRPGGPALTGDVLAFVESVLGIQIYEGIKETFKRHNGLFMGLELYSLETCLVSTLQCREHYRDNKRRKKLKKSLVISGDGAGNPILISETGQLYLFHHDDITFEVVPQTFLVLFQRFLDELEQLPQP